MFIEASEGASDIPDVSNSKKALLNPKEVPNPLKLITVIASEELFESTKVPPWLLAEAHPLIIPQAAHPSFVPE